MFTQNRSQCHQFIPLRCLFLTSSLSILKSCLFKIPTLNVSCCGKYPTIYPVFSIEIPIFGPLLLGDTSGPGTLNNHVEVTQNSSSADEPWYMNIICWFFRGRYIGYTVVVSATVIHISFFSWCEKKFHNSFPGSVSKSLKEPRTLINCPGDSSDNFGGITYPEFWGREDMVTQSRLFPCAKTFQLLQDIEGILDFLGMSRNVWAFCLTLCSKNTCGAVLPRGKTGIRFIAVWQFGEWGVLLGLAVFPGRFLHCHWLNSL